MRLILQVTLQVRIILQVTLQVRIILQMTLQVIFQARIASYARFCRIGWNN